MRKIAEKQKKMNETFLAAYRELEKTVSDVEGCSIFELEAKLGQESEESGRLKLCRMERNFLAHNDASDGFASASQAMIDFLKEETEKEKRKKKTAGEVARRIRPAHENDSLQECAARLAKLPFVPTTDENGMLLGVITPESICAAYAEAPLNARTKAKPAVTKCAAVSAYMPAEEITESCVVADGSGKYRGIIIIK